MIYFIRYSNSSTSSSGDYLYYFERQQKELLLLGISTNYDRLCELKWQFLNIWELQVPVDELSSSILRPELLTTVYLKIIYPAFAASKYSSENVDVN